MNRLKFLALSSALLAISVYAEQQIRLSAWPNAVSVMVSGHRAEDDSNQSIDYFIEKVKLVANKLDQVKAFHGKHFKDGKVDDTFAYAKVGVNADFARDKEKVVEDCLAPFLSAMSRSNELKKAIDELEKKKANLASKETRTEEQKKELSSLPKKISGKKADKERLDAAIFSALNAVDAEANLKAIPENLDDYKMAEHSVATWWDDWKAACDKELGPEGIGHRVNQEFAKIAPKAADLGDDFAGWEQGFTGPLYKFSALVIDCHGLLSNLISAKDKKGDALFADAADLDKKIAGLASSAAANVPTIAKKLGELMDEVASTVEPSATASSRHTRVKMAKLREYIGLAGEFRTKVVNAISDACEQFGVDIMKEELNAVADAGADLQKKITDVQRKYALASDDISGVSDAWAMRRIPLFYYPDPMGIVQSLRPSETPRLINPDSETAAKNAANANAKLREVEAEIFATTSKINNSKSRILSIRAEIAQITQDLNAANREQTRLTRAKDDLLATKGKTDTAITNETTRQATVKAALDAEKAKTPDPNKPEEVAQHERELARLQRDLDLSNTKLAALNKKSENEANQATAYDRQIADNGAAVTALDERKKALVDDQQKLPADLKNAEDALVTLQKDLAKARAERIDRAQVDVEAFANSVVSEPMYILEADQARMDAAGRVQMVVYPRSKMLMLRGPAADVQRVHQWVSIFDRPAPQAKISIHSLQINGSDPRKINEAVEKANQAIRRAKSRVQIVQDTLRIALNREVAHCAVAAKAVYDSDLNDRFYRTFFFHPEVRQQLGMITPDPRSGSAANAWNAQRAVQDLDGLAANLAHTASLYESAKTYGEAAKGTARKKDFARAHRAAGFELRQSLTNLGYYLAQLYSHITNCNGGINNFVRDTNKFLKATKSALQCVRNRDDNFEEFGQFCKDICESLNYSSCSKKDLQAIFEALNVLRTSLSSQSYTGESELLKYDEQVSAAVLPDPSRATTLGEMIFMISLASEESRRNILEEFSNQLYTETVTSQYLKLGQPDDRDALARLAAAIYVQFGVPARSGELFSLPGADTTLTPLFPRTVFGANGNALRINNSMVSSINYPTDQTNATTSNQLEILYALKARVRTALLLSLENADDSSVESSSTVETFSKVAMFLAGQWSRERCRNEVTNPTRFSFKEPISRLAASAGSSAPRIAAADQMLKRFIESFETDFDAYFMDQMVDEIRRATLGSGVQFGAYEKRSILASNRLLTRQDVTATGSSIMDPDRDLRAEAATLFGLVDSVAGKKSTGGKSAVDVASGAITAGAGAAYAARQAISGDPTRLTQFGLVGSLLGGLLSLPNEPQGEVYSIGSGGTFKVIPIFDPTGQGVRFRFDYVQSVRVQEPDGTTKPELSRIERHTTNTEVAVSNLDLQEISSFESNMRIGNPLKKSGGIPILRDLLPDFPIVGYFVKRGGAQPLRQHTLIFAQTVMYPSIADLGELMVDTPIFGSSKTVSATTGRAVYAYSPNDTTFNVSTNRSISNLTFAGGTRGTAGIRFESTSNRPTLKPKVNSAKTTKAKPKKAKKRRVKK